MRIESNQLTMQSSSDGHPIVLMHGNTKAKETGKGWSSIGSQAWNIAASLRRIFRALVNQIRSPCYDIGPKGLIEFWDDFLSSWI